MVEEFQAQDDTPHVANKWFTTDKDLDCHYRRKRKKIKIKRVS